jgi:FlaA1/EpsC-like NDP-sugar epimerase
LFSIFLVSNALLSQLNITLFLIYIFIANFLFLFWSFVSHTPFEMWEFTSIKESLVIIKIVFFTVLLMTPYYFQISSSFSSFICLYLVNLLITVPILLIPRFAFRIWKESKKIKETKIADNGNGNGKKQKRILIIGAGSAAEKITREIENHPELHFLVVGYLDDNPAKHNSVLRGNRVFGPISQVKHVTQSLHIDEVLIAIPTSGGSVARKVLSSLSLTHVVVRTLPGIWEMVSGQLDISSIRKIKVEDLLEREPIKTNIAEIATYLTNKTVLITGAGGSIGSELARQVAKYSPKQLILLGRGENRIFKIDNEIREQIKFEQVIPVIADIRDVDKINWLLGEFKPDIVFHCAAHKHVPLMEKNPDEAFTNNIIGSWNLLKASQAGNVKLFVNISTDKAVNPINVMGASKRVVELLTRSYNGQNNMISCNVRFGNVLGSEGSVLQLFQKQLTEDAVIKVTDPNMERFFMLIPEAVELVLQAGALTKGDEMFVLKMGKQINILEFAKSYIKLSGLELNKDAKIIITGNRGNEKLSEELWYEGSTLEKTSNPWIVKVVSQSSNINIQKDIQSSPLFQRSLNQLSAEQIKTEIYKLLHADTPYNKPSCIWTPLSVK